MKPDNRNDGVYGEISAMESGMFRGEVVEVWNSCRWSTAYCLDYTAAGVHRWLHGHGVKYSHLSIIDSD